MPRTTPMKASELVILYTTTQDQYDAFEANNAHDALANRVGNFLAAPNSRISEKNVNDVVQMYLDVKHGSAPRDSTYASTSSSSSYRRSPSSRNTSSSWFSGIPSFTYVDNSWNWGTYNTTNNNTSSSSNTNNKKEEKESSAEAMLMMLAVGVILSITAFIAAISFGHLFSELANHTDRLFNNDGVIQGSLLLMGVGVSYCLAMLSIYELAGSLIIGTMVAAGFANPAVWACSAIAFSAIIATPVVNMLVREGIYSLFSLFDNQALVSTDNRFRVLTQAEVDSLDKNIDPNRVNFATRCKYEELKPSQTRQRFAFFDYNSPEMNDALKETRAMRKATGSNATVQLELPDSEQKVSFSLFRTAGGTNPNPSAPPMAHAEPYVPSVATAVYDAK